MAQLLSSDTETPSTRDTESPSLRNVESPGGESSVDGKKKTILTKKRHDGTSSDISDSSNYTCTLSGSPYHSRKGFMSYERRSYTQDQLNDFYPLPGPPKTAPLLHMVKQKCRCSGSCLVNGLLGFLPIGKVLKHYSAGSYLFMDVVCGLSAGFLHLPQGLGFGLLANLTPVYGLYTSLFPVLVYMVFGTSPHVSMGTNAVVALLSASIIDQEVDHYLANQAPNHTVSAAELLENKVCTATAAALLEGIILIGMGLLRMGFLTTYMSNSFIGGFSFAAAVHISVSQVSEFIVKLLHLTLQTRSGMGKLVFTTADVVTHITDTNIADLIVGVICGAMLLGINEGINKRYKHRLKVPVPAELLVVILSTLVSHFARLDERFNVQVVGDIPQGLPSPSLPPVEPMPRIVKDAFVDAILIFVLTISLAKLTAKLHMITIDDNQELLAYGLCQVVGSFFQNFSSSISPPRTMMLSSMGSRSTLNGISTALFLLLVLLVAGPLFVSLPIAMLSVMIILAMKDLLLQVLKVKDVFSIPQMLKVKDVFNLPQVLKMKDVLKVKDLWYVNKGDFLIWVLTVVFGVVGDLDVGLLAGTLASVVMVLAYSQLAHGILLGKASGEDLYLNMDRRDIHPIPGVRIFRFVWELHFASAERFRSEIYRKIFDPTTMAHKDHYEIDVADPGSATDQRDLRPVVHVHLSRRGNLDTIKQSRSSSRRSRSGFQGLKISQELVPEENVSNNAAAAAVSPTVETLEEEEEVRFVIVDCSTMTYIDLTGVEMLHLIITQFSRAGVAMMLTDIPPTTLAILNRAKFFEHEDFSKVYFNVLDALHDIQSLRISGSFVKSFA
ncbi:sulfate transporter-like [Babylonia areolata]|uniref:sulfate transporter-like n=1 Tax=Babylonia areolata TaxID=304850 RepID=UPI003FCFD88B